MPCEDEEPDSGPSRLDLDGDVEPAEDPVAARDRERRRGRSALIGAVAALIVILLTIIGVWTSIQNISSVPRGVEQSAPASAPRSP